MLRDLPQVEFLKPGPGFTSLGVEESKTLHGTVDLSGTVVLSLLNSRARWVGPMVRRIITSNHDPFLVPVHASLHMCCGIPQGQPAAAAVGHIGV